MINSAKKILEPQDATELVRGWLLHAHKGRDRHDEAARNYDFLQTWIGCGMIISSAVAGLVTAITTAQPAATSPKIFVAVLSFTSTVLAGFQTFLDYAGRAERHRIAGVKYKSVIRELEYILVGGQIQEGLDKDWFPKFRERLDATEASSPQVSAEIYATIEDRYLNVTRVATTMDLSRPPRDCHPTSQADGDG